MRWSLLLPLCIFWIAVLPRATFLVELRAAPTYDRPEGGDSMFYDRVADGEAGAARAYFHSPLYRWFLTGVYRVAGRNLTAARVIQHLLGALTAVLVYLITLHLFGRRWPAAAAGVLQGTLGPLVFYEGQLLLCSLLAACLALAALAALRYSRRPSWSGALFLGLAVGVGALCRPTILIWTPAVLAWMLLRARGEGWAPAAHALVFCAGAALLILPVTARNYAVEKDLVLITSNSGLNLYIGNNAAARGTYNLPAGLWFEPGDPGADFSGISAFRRATGGGEAASSSRISRWWAGKALDFWRRHPRRGLELMLTKLTLLISHYEHPQLYNYYVYKTICPTLLLLPTAGLIIALGLVGLIAALIRGRGHPGWLIALLVVLYGASFLLFFVEGRYRAPWLTLLSPFAAWTVAAMVDQLRRRTFMKAALLSAAAAAAALVCFLLPVEPKSTSPQLHHFGRALVSTRPGQAAAWFRRSIEADPENPLPHEGLGIALSRTGRHRQALEVLRRAAAIWPSSARIQNNLGLVLRRQGHAAAAEDALRRAVFLDPSLGEAYANLGDLLEARGAPRRAAESYRSALLMAPARASWAPLVRRRLDRVQRNARP